MFDRFTDCSVECLLVLGRLINEPVGNLGAVFDPNMNISAHVSKGIKRASGKILIIGLSYPL